MKKNALYILFLFGFLTSLVSCQDDNIIDDNFDPSLKGTSEVSFNLEFKPLTPALESRTAGNAIKHINDLNIVIYKADGSLYKHFFVEKGTDNKLPSTSEELTNIEETTYNDNKPSTEGGTDGYNETNACRVSFKYVLPYGQYKIIAVANCGQLSEKQVESEESIRKIQLTWNADEIASNNQMFGYFRTSTDYQDVIKSNAETITISSATHELHAWLKRAASKVTVAFDGTNLNENVYIYIKSATIKDIPKHCYLGAKNEVKIDGVDSPTEEQKKTVLHEKGESISYANKSTNYKDWLLVTKAGKEGNGTAGLFGSNHSETADALFFYENMQGIGETKKQEDKNTDGIVDDNTTIKDNKPYGTYIEVEGYYVNNDNDKLSQGDIKYRFMLGKDIDTDYNAERNYHYKLTLMFNKDANNPDWHIDYDEEPGIIVPEPYYISYSYNERFMLPVKINGGTLVGNLKAEIKSDASQNAWNKNNWVPVGGTASTYDYSNNSRVVTKSGDYFNKNNVKNAGAWNGFLSLAADNAAIVESPYGTSGDANKNLTYSYNKTYWEKNPKNASRTYTPKTTEGKENVSDKDGDYIRAMSNSGKQSFEIPIYTRPKTLVTQTGYSGMNIYTSFNREAIVKLTATIKDSNGNQNVYTKYVTITQAKRIVNPAGIWRKHDNNASFDVTVMEELNNSSFKPLVSEGGPWRAYVESGGNWIKLSVTSGGNGDITSSTENGKTIISGSTNGEVRFTYTPNGTIAATEVRCGVIRVEYNNYHCVHRIFVRQGYAPLQIVSGGAKWHSYNMYKENEEAQSPLEEGTFFKFANWGKGIYATNNNTYGFNVVPGELDLIGDNGYWDNLTPKKGENHSLYSSGFSNPTKINANTRVSTYKDWNALRNSCDFAFGVLYGDGASQTATTVENAYGYVRKDGVNSPKGMRGCFVYNKSTGKNLFFPIGATGYGRRTSNLYVLGSGGGVLRYATMYNLMRSSDWVEYRPMLYDLMFSEGATYWLQKEQTIDGTTHSAWDINYRTLDFNTFTTVGWQIIGSTKYESDACFVRCVED